MQHAVACGSTTFSRVAITIPTRSTAGSPPHTTPLALFTSVSSLSLMHNIFIMLKTTKKKIKTEMEQDFFEPAELSH